MRVLVVEDETLLAQAMTKRLSADGHNCVWAASLRAANDHLRADAPELVLLDVRLPDGNGLDLMAQARSGGPAFVVVTARGDVEDAVAAMKQGASDYLKKPLDLNELSRGRRSHRRTPRHQGETAICPCPRCPGSGRRDPAGRKRAADARARGNPLAGGNRQPRSGRPAAERPDPWRNGDRQGPGGALSACLQSARQAALRSRRLCFIARRAD